MAVLPLLTLQGLTTAARRAVIRAVIPEFWALGYSATAARTYLRQFGPTLRWSSFLDEWREVTGAKKAEKVWRFTPKKYREPKAAMVPTAQPTKQEFMYKFKVSGIELETGEPGERWFTLATDEWLAPAQAEAQMVAAIAEKGDYYIWLYDFDMDLATLHREVTYRSKRVWEEV